MLSIFAIDPNTGQTIEITTEQMRSYFCEAREPIESEPEWAEYEIIEE